jgi:hypothetical protein
MHRLLGSALPALLLVTAPVLMLGACGDEKGDDSGSDPGGDPSTVISVSGGESDSGGDSGFDLVDTITVTAAGGAVNPAATALTDDASVQEFVSQFESDELITQVQATIAETEVPPGQALYAAVVAIGCDSPTDVSVVETTGGLLITATKVPTPKVECFAPMTTVALVLAAAA